MASASQEFSHTYNFLIDEVASFKSKYNELKLQVSKLFEENKRLNSELKENAISNARLLSENGVSELQLQLDAAIASKDAAVELWQESLRQLERQEELLLGKKSILEVERGESDKLLHQLQEEYIKGLNILSLELTTYRNELSRVSLELRTRSTELDVCKRDLETLRTESDKNKAAMADMTAQKSKAEDKLSTLQTLLAETENFLTATKEEMEACKRDNAEMSAQVSDLKDQNKKLKDAAAVYERDAKESLRKAQEAVLQKKEMAYREQEYVKEIEHLKSSVEFEAGKIAFNCKSEIKEISEEYEKRIKELMEEIEALHQDIGEKQSLFEKATREKQALESKLELLHSEFSDGSVSSSVEDLCKRLTTSERTRDELEFKVRSLETRMSELNAYKDQEIACLKEGNEKLNSRTAKLVDDFNVSSTDRIKLNDENVRLKKRCNELEKELRNAKSKEMYEVSLCVTNAKQTEKSLLEKLKSVEEHYTKKCDDLQNLLDSQFKISAKWKEEVDAVIVKSEVKIKELCQTVITLQNQNKELCEFIAKR